LINFEKWVHLKEKALDAFRYRDFLPAYDADGHGMAMAYIGWELRSVSVDDVFSRALRDRSSRLKRGEETLTMRREEARLALALGFS
jgi:hypothetical protein